MLAKDIDVGQYAYSGRPMGTGRADGEVANGATVDPSRAHGGTDADAFMSEAASRAR
jgi:hypothetical protein